MVSWAGTLGKEVPSAPTPASPGGHKKEVVGLGGRWVLLPRCLPSPVGRLSIVTSIFSSFLSNLSTGEKPRSLPAPPCAWQPMGMKRTACWGSATRHHDVGLPGAPQDSARALLPHGGRAVGTAPPVPGGSEDGFTVVLGCSHSELCMIQAGFLGDKRKTAWVTPKGAEHRAALLPAGPIRASP